MLINHLLKKKKKSSLGDNTLPWRTTPLETLKEVPLIFPYSIHAMAVFDINILIAITNGMLIININIVSILLHRKNEKNTKQFNHLKVGKS